jgi:hypothetical protein
MFSANVQNIDARGASIIQARRVHNVHIDNHTDGNTAHPFTEV